VIGVHLVEEAMHRLTQDVRYAIRLLRRSPGFTVTATLTFALAIGANAAIFSAVKGVLIAPLPYADPDRLVRLFEQTPTFPHFAVSPADFRDYRAELQTFDGLAAYMRADLQLGDRDHPEQLRGMQVTGGFFSLLGYRMMLGRDFTTSDELQGNSDIVILSHAVWMRRFNGDASIVGTTARFSGRSFRVVGVLPDAVKHVGGTFRTYGHDEPVDVWWVLPVPRDERPGLRFSHFYNVVGRMRHGVTWAQMEEDLRRTGRDVAKRYPGLNSPYKPSVVPLKTEIVGTAASTLLVLAGAASAVLLLACVNVAGLLFGRASGRSREIGVRAAIGATRGQLARQLLVESLVLASIGGAVGVGVAYLAIRGLARFGPTDMPRLQMIALDIPVLVYTIAATLLSAVACGLAPAIRLRYAGLIDTLKEGVRTVAGSAHQRTRRALVAVEVALAFCLVVSSGLLLRSFVSLMNTNPGFKPGAAITASVELPTARYSDVAASDFYRRAAERMRQLPGVQDVAFSSDLPWTNYDENTSFAILGRQFPEGEGPQARYHFITPGYTQATGTRLVAGRDVTFSDVQNATRVIVVNEAAARKYWKSPQNALGARVNLWGAERTVAGVIGNVRDMPWHDRAAPAIYFPQAQQWYAQTMFLIVRSALDPSSMVEPIRRAVREIDPELPLANIRPLESVAGAAMATRRLTLWLVGAFGLTALFLAVVGIYGVMAQDVAQRNHEFGIRQALGASRAEIMRLVLSTGAVMTLAGLVSGVALALGTTQLLTTMLYSVRPLDPVTFAAVAFVLVAAAVGAAYLPARRATRVSAATALHAAE